MESFERDVRPALPQRGDHDRVVRADRGGDSVGVKRVGQLDPRIPGDLERQRLAHRGAERSRVSVAAEQRQMEIVARHAGDRADQVVHALAPLEPAQIEQAEGGAEGVVRLRGGLRRTDIGRTDQDRRGQCAGPVEAAVRVEDVSPLPQHRIRVPERVALHRVERLDRQPAVEVAIQHIAHLGRGVDPNAHSRLRQERVERRRRLHRHECLAEEVRKFDQIGATVGIQLLQPLVRAGAVAVHHVVVAARLLLGGLFHERDPYRARR